MSYFNKKRLYPILILLLSGFLVFWQFTKIPSGLAADEVEFAKLALSLDGKWQLFSPLATGHTTFYFYLLLFSIKSFGLSTFALRLPAAILAVLNSLLFYKLLRFFFKNNLSFLGAIIFCSSHWVLNFGRYAFEATYLLFFELLAVIFLLQFLKTKRKRFYCLSLVASIFAFYSYLPGRIFFLLPLFILLINKAKPSLTVTYLIVLIIFAFPLLFAGGIMENRVLELTYLSKNMPLKTKFSYFTQNLGKNILMLNFEGDLNGRHNYPKKPGLNPALGILFWLGIIAGLKKLKSSSLFYFWAIISIAPSLFTMPNENPHFLRTYTLTVSLVFFITLSLFWIVKKRPRAIYWLALLILLSGIYEVRTYFKYQTQVFKNAFEKKEVDLYQLQTADNIQK